MAQNVTNECHFLEGGVGSQTRSKIELGIDKCKASLHLTNMPRKPKHPIEYTYVIYKDQAYTIGMITRTNTTTYDDENVYFIIDRADKERVQTHNWFVAANKYIGCYAKGADGNRKTLYLHNFIMGRMEFLGKGQQSSIDHISGIEFDNRRCNLRDATQGLQNRNTEERARRVNRLPETIHPDELPRNIWYIPARASHGERFAVEFKGIPDVGNIVKKTTASKSIDVRTKLSEAIRIKNEILEHYPILVEYSRLSEQSEQLRQDYRTLVDYMTAV
jgi:hypothetical protein